MILPRIKLLVKRALGVGRAPAHAPPERGPWTDLLERARADVRRLDPNPYYPEYARGESLYWRHVPRWIYEQCQASPPARCLDVGCAYGTLLVYVKLAGAREAYGVDFMDHYMSKKLLAAHGVRFAVSNIELEPCPFPGPFDVILFTEVLEHLNYFCVPTLRKLRGLLSETGRLYLTTPDASAWGKTTRYYKSYRELPEPPPGQTNAQPIDDHVWQFDVSELLECVHEAGLKVERFDYAPGTVGRHFNLALSKRPGAEAGGAARGDGIRGVGVETSQARTATARAEAARG